MEILFLIGKAIGTTFLVYSMVIILSRVVGLRSFSKMSGFDFVVTVALGSMMAGTIISEKPPLLLSSVAFATLFGLQMLTAKFRYRFQSKSRHIDNRPLVLVQDGEVKKKNLEKVMVSREELYSRLRDRGVMRMDDVKLAVLETTGGLSVLSNHDKKGDIDEKLLIGLEV